MFGNRKTGQKTCLVTERQGKDMFDNGKTGKEGQGKGIFGNRMRGKTCYLRERQVKTCLLTEGQGKDMLVDIETRESLVWAQNTES